MKSEGSKEQYEKKTEIGDFLETREGIASEGGADSRLFRCFHRRFAQSFSVKCLGAKSREKPMFCTE